jgi:hypothetical protein
MLCDDGTYIQKKTANQNEWEKGGNVQQIFPSVKLFPGFKWGGGEIFFLLDNGMKRSIRARASILV